MGREGQQSSGILRILGREHAPGCPGGLPYCFVGLEDSDLHPTAFENQCAGEADDATARDRDVLGLPHDLIVSGWGS